ncbi:MAG: recombination protein RecR [Candidatus Magasanikbacteria bacterium]|nr:recombination protein RecR [Candidatus Magasanikbacteria bacterium]
MAYSSPIENLIQAFSKLPSVGQKTAERFVFYLLKSGKKDVAQLTLALKELIQNIKSCEQCWDFTDSEICSVCSDRSRDQSIICVVSEPQGVQVIEKTNEYNGLYHVLRGTIRADDIDSHKYLKIDELMKRIKLQKTKEIVLAMNPDINGETTMMFLENQIKQLDPGAKVTRLVRGLPMGADLHYADEITLASALKNRIEN